MDEFIATQSSDTINSITRLKTQLNIGLIDSYEYEFRVYELLNGDKIAVKTYIIGKINSRLSAYIDNIEKDPINIPFSDDLTHTGELVFILVLYLVKLCAFKEIYETSECPVLTTLNGCVYLLVKSPKSQIGSILTSAALFHYKPICDLGWIYTHSGNLYGFRT